MIDWISVEDRFPNNARILGYCQEDETIDHYSVFDGVYWNLNSNNECTEGFLEHVTHWAEITLPK